jgi:hypothetical protein
VIRHRLQVFAETTGPLVPYYTERGILVAVDKASQYVPARPGGACEPAFFEAVVESLVGPVCELGAA